MKARLYYNKDTDKAVVEIVDSSGKITSKHEVEHVNSNGCNFTSVKNSKDNAHPKFYVEVHNIDCIVVNLEISSISFRPVGLMA